jgi:hypothetical protein
VAIPTIRQSGGDELMAPSSPEQWLKRLIQHHNAELGRLRLFDLYYRGQQPLSYMAPELLRELDDRLRAVVINWPQLVVDALDERLDVEGFRYAESTSGDDELWAIWQENCLDLESQMGHLDALAMKRSWGIVGAGDDDDDPPVVTVESPLEMVGELDPRTRRVAAAVKRWNEEHLDAGPAVGEQGSQSGNRATLYLPGLTVWYTQNGDEWVETDRDDHGVTDRGEPVALAVPLANKARLRERMGRSEIEAIMPISDAACKIATDMMVAGEFHALPRRWAVGVGPDAFVDAQGRQVSMLSKVAGKVWAIDEDPSKVNLGQFPESNLEGFIAVINTLARIVGSLAGLPPHYLGLATDQPPSADAIRSAEIRLIKRAERRQRGFGEGWEKVMRLARTVQTGAEDPKAYRLETEWRDAATPTTAQKADAAVKLVAAGIIPVEQAREDLGYTQEQRDRMVEMDDRAASRILGGDLATLAGGAPADPSPIDPGSKLDNPEPAPAGV